MLTLLDTSEDRDLVLACMTCLKSLATTSAARDLMEPDAIAKLAAFSERSHDDDSDGSPDWYQAIKSTAGATLVHLAWNVQSARSRHQQNDVLTAVVGRALPAFVAAIDSGLMSDEVLASDAGAPDRRELGRQALWAVATWLGLDPPHGRAAFVRAHGMFVLLKVDENNTTAEMRTFTRVICSKILGALGDDLSTKILLLRGEASVCQDLDGMWAAMAASVDDQ